MSLELTCIATLTEHCLPDMSSGRRPNAHCYPSKCVDCAWFGGVIFYKLVQAVCSSGGDVLNVGFGLGLVDRAIQSNQPTSHTIIEAHPDVLQKVHFWNNSPGSQN